MGNLREDQGKHRPPLKNPMNILYLDTIPMTYSRIHGNDTFTYMNTLKCMVHVGNTWSENGIQKTWETPSCCHFSATQVMLVDLAAGLAW